MRVPLLAALVTTACGPSFEEASDKVGSRYCDLASPILGGPSDGDQHAHCLETGPSYSDEAACGFCARGLWIVREEPEPPEFWDATIECEVLYDGVPCVRDRVRALIEACEDLMSFDRCRCPSEPPGPIEATTVWPCTVRAD